jgi:hypothetical protein
MSFTFGAPGFVNDNVCVAEIPPVETIVTVRVYVPAPKLDIVACPLALVVNATAAAPFNEYVYEVLFCKPVNNIDPSVPLHNVGLVGVAVNVGTGFTVTTAVVIHPLLSV